MRFPLAIAACFGLALASTTVTGEALAQPSSGGRLLVFDGQSGAQSGTEAGGVRILRGSAAPPRRAAPDREGGPILGPGRVQAVAGEEFWLYDRRTQKLASCRNRSTANVGERLIECTFGTFGRYRRTFGDNFPH